MSKQEEHRRTKRPSGWPYLIGILFVVIWWIAMASIMYHFDK